MSIQYFVLWGYLQSGRSSCAEVAAVEKSTSLTRDGHMASVSKICWDYFARHLQELDINCCSFCWTKLDILSKYHQQESPMLELINSYVYHLLRPTVYLQNFSYTKKLSSSSRTVITTVSQPVQFFSQVTTLPSNSVLVEVFQEPPILRGSFRAKHAWLGLLRAKGCWEITLAIASIDLPYTLGYTMRLFLLNCTICEDTKISC